MFLKNFPSPSKFALFVKLIPSPSPKFWLAFIVAVFPSTNPPTALKSAAVRVALLVVKPESLTVIATSPSSPTIVFNLAGQLVTVC